MKSVPFLTEDKTRSIHREFGTPVFVYDQRTLEHQARLVLGFPNAFGLTARYAVKACPTRAVTPSEDSSIFVGRKLGQSPGSFSVHR